MATFTDDFNRADSTSLGAGWVEVSGDWSIVSNQLSPGASGGTIILRAAAAMASNDHYVQTTIAATTAASHGVWARGNANISSGYLLRNDGASWDLFSVVSSTFTVIGTYAVPAAPGDVVRLEVIGSTIKGFVNGIQRISVTNTAVASGTSVGFRSESTSAIRFDNFTAADVTSGVAGDATLTPAATLNAAGTRATAAGANLSAAAALSAGGVRAATSTGSLTATTLLAADGSMSTSTGSILQATANLTADGTRAIPAGANLAATAAADAAGHVGHPGETVLAGTVTLAAAGTIIAPPVAADSALPLAGIVVAAGTRTALAVASRSTTAALAAAGTTALHGDTAVAATATLTASGATSGTAVDDVDVTVGTPHGAPCTAGAPHTSGWVVGAPW